VSDGVTNISWQNEPLAGKRYKGDREENKTDYGSFCIKG